MKVIRSLLLLFAGLCFTLLADSQTAVPAKAVVAMNATWTDTATNLMWADMDNGKDVSWNQATAYCSELQLAGLSGWRLPTIEELQGIHSSSGALTKTSMDFGDAWVHVKGNLKLTGWHWSSSQGDAGSNGPWSFSFAGEKAEDGFPVGFTYNMRALCVRRSDS